jgi:uncharacterized caspase-like protein
MLRVLFVLLVVLLPTVAHADKRVALVIGNSAYQHAGKLINPKNDAEDISAALRKLNVKVIEGFDLDKITFDRTVRAFAKALQGADAGIMFYAGHGLQVAGQNYLVPVDAELSTISALDFEMVRVDVIQRIMETEVGTNALFIDACRDNPLARNLARAMGTRSTAIGKGFAPVESGIGTIISFSTQPGNVALDGSGRNSPFAGALVKHIAASHDELSAILIAVRNDVMKETQRKQVPWEHSALTRKFYLRGSPQTAVSIAPAQMTDQQLEIALWHSIKDSRSSELLQLFLERHPNGTFATAARQAFERAKQDKAAGPALANPSFFSPSINRPPAQTLTVKLSLATAPTDMHRGVIGVSIVPLQSEWAKTLGLAQKAVWIVDVAKNGPAAKADLQPGDVITRLGGGEVHDARSFARAIAGMRPDATVTLEIWRVGTTAIELQTWLRAAAEAGETAAIASLAYAHTTPMFGVPQVSETLRWNRKSAELGDILAMRMLGVTARDGLLGVPKNEIDALSWFQKSAAGGDPFAMRYLANAYSEGRGTTRDVVAGAQWTVKALLSGDHRTQTEMATTFGGWGEDFRRELQIALRDAGVYTGPIDGSFSPSTQQAIETLNQRRR